MEDAKNILEVAQKALTILALLAGGVWGYYKFFKGRVFRIRLEPTISGRVLPLNNSTYLLVTISLKNVGLSKVDLEQEGTGLRLSTHKAVPRLDDPIEADWSHLTTFPVFREHAWIEPGETITEDRMFVVPGIDHFAFQLVIRLISHKVAIRTTKVLSTTPENAEESP
jgi:hypothetical protein